MDWRLTISGEGLTPDAEQRARGVFEQTMIERLGGRQQVEQHFRAWDRVATALADREACLTPEDSDRARVYLLALEAASHAAAELLDEVLFLDFDFEVVDAD